MYSFYKYLYLSVRKYMFHVENRCRTKIILNSVQKARNIYVEDNAKKFFFYCVNQVSIVSMYPTMDGSGSIPIVLTTSVTLSISGSMDKAFKK